MSGPRLSEVFESIIEGCHETIQTRIRESLSALTQAGVREVGDIQSRFERLEQENRVTATWLLGTLGDKRAVPKLLEIMQHDVALAVRGQAARELSVLGGKRAIKGLIRLVEDPNQSEDIRCNAGYALAFLSEEGIDVEVFRRVLADAHNPPDVRAQAAEGLAYHLNGLDRRRRAWRRCIDTLITHLTDPDVEVRFYCVFALGSQYARKALPHLRTLAISDKTVSRSMGWTVQDEARDAIFSIEHGAWPKQDAYARTYLASQPTPGHDNASVNRAAEG